MSQFPWLAPVQSQVIQRIQAQQLHHGLLFVTDHGCGESQLLSNVAKALLCENVARNTGLNKACDSCKSCLLFSALSHPDLVKVVTDKPSIGVDLIRKVSEFVTTTSQLLGNKVVIIDDIHLMTEAASNSLLKTLEEPANNTYILMSTHQPDNLLATVKSRCEKIRVKLPSHQDALAWLATQSNETFTIEGLQAYANSPIHYLEALQDSKHSHFEFSKDIQALKDRQISGLALATKWQHEASLVLRWTYQWCMQQYKEALENKSNIGGISDVQTMVEQCQTANIKINQAGINKSLILQHVFNTIQQR